MNGLLGTWFPWAITRPEDESRAASAPPIKVLLCMLVGSCPLPDLPWLLKAWLAIFERVLSLGFPGLPGELVYSSFDLLLLIFWINESTGTHAWRLTGHGRSHVLHLTRDFHFGFLTGIEYTPNRPLPSEY